MVMGMSNEEMEAWEKKICFSTDVRSNTSVRVGYAPGQEIEFWERGASQESPECAENPKDDNIHVRGF